MGGCCGCMPTMAVTDLTLTQSIWFIRLLIFWRCQSPIIITNYITTRNNNKKDTLTYCMERYEGHNSPI